MACDADDHLNHGNRPRIRFTSFGSSIGLTPLPWTDFPWLIGILPSYLRIHAMAGKPFISGLSNAGRNVGKCLLSCSV